MNFQAANIVAYRRPGAGGRIQEMWLGQASEAQLRSPHA